MQTVPGPVKPKKTPKIFFDPHPLIFLDLTYNTTTLFISETTSAPIAVKVTQKIMSVIGVLTVSVGVAQRVARVIALVAVEVPGTLVTVLAGQVTETVGVAGVTFGETSAMVAVWSGWIVAVAVRVATEVAGAVVAGLVGLGALLVGNAADADPVDLAAP